MDRAAPEPAELTTREEDSVHVARRMAVLVLVVGFALGLVVLPSHAADIVPVPSPTASPEAPPSPTATEDETQREEATEDETQTEGATEDDADDDGAGPPVLFGTMRNADGPVEGVTVSVAGADGAEVGTATTNEQGQWELELPEPGEYLVTIDVNTLPEGVTLRDPEALTSTEEVSAGDRQAVIFPLGEGATGYGRFQRIMQQTANGLKLGLIIAMTAVGLSLVFGTTGLINFAHSELVVFGAVVAWGLNATGPEWHLLIAAPAAVVIAAALGGVLDRGLFRPLRKRRVTLFQLLVISIGLGLAMRFTILIFFGGQPATYTNYIGQQVMQIGPIAQTPRDFAIMALSVIALVAVATMLQTTRIGKAMRAVADNRDLAESSGIDVQRVILIVWISGAGLAGLGGVFYGLVFGVDYFFGFEVLLLMFAGVILGGLGTAYGAMVGSVVIGLITELSVVWFPNELKRAWPLGVLVLILLLRPQGILGSRERIG